MKVRLQILLGTILTVVGFNSNAQFVKVINANIISSYITPGSLCNVTVINTYESGQYIFQAVLLNSSGIPVLEIRSQAFTLNSGTFMSLNGKFNFEVINYSGDYAGDYLNTHKSLPPGKYTYCCFLQPVFNNSDVISEEYCIDLEGENRQNLNLVFPDDKDTINTHYPLLIWNSFPNKRNLSVDESFRILICELSENQHPEEAILVNKPVLYEEHIKSTQLQYPPNEVSLKKGSHYTWQVHKVSQNMVIASSEIWTFFVDEPKSIPQSYIIPKKSEDSGFFYLRDKKFYIKFTEPAENNILACSLRGSDVNRTGKSNDDILVQYLGHNIYEISVERLKLRKGSYTMEITNHLNNKYYVKFYVENKL